MSVAAATTPLPMGKVLPALDLCYRSGRLSVMFWGPPGTAKSALIKQFAAQKRLTFVDVRLPLFDPVDLKGIPSLENAKITVVRDGKEFIQDIKVTRFHSPDFLPREACVILFDELANALPATQTAAQRIILDRTSDGGWVAHPDTLIVAASNRRTDRCGVNSMPAALDNRLVHFEVKPDVPFWTSWLLSEYGDTEDKRFASTLINAFIQYRSDHAYRFDPDQAAKGIHGFPTFRSWETVCKMLILANASSISVQDEVLGTAIKGTIGYGTGHEFIMFCRLKDKLPNIDGILTGKPWEVPVEPDVKYALVGALAGRVTPKNFNAMWNVVDKLEVARASDFGVVLVRMVLKQNPNLKQTDNFIKWAQKHRQVIGC